MRWLDAGGPAEVGSSEMAMQLIEAAGPALAPGTLARNLVEERVAHSLAGASATLTRLLGPIAARLGFGAATPG